jgi:hypothetical protein
MHKIHCLGLSLAYSVKASTSHLFVSPKKRSFIAASSASSMIPLSLNGQTELLLALNQHAPFQWEIQQKYLAAVVFVTVPHKFVCRPLLVTSHRRISSACPPNAATRKIHSRVFPPRQPSCKQFVTSRTRLAAVTSKEFLNLFCIYSIRLFAQLPHFAQLVSPAYAWLTGVAAERRRAA